MNISKFIDSVQKRINSILFRFVLIAYSIAILFIYQNFFPTYAYVIASIIYFIIYLQLGSLQYLRLFNDFIFISLILFNKNPNEPFLFLFLILPIINSINFSGQKRSTFLYLITIIVYILLLCRFNHNYNINFVGKNLYPIIGIFFLWIINGYTSLRLKIRSFRDELNDIVDSFYIKNEYIKKPHKIYKILISVINQNIKSNLIEDIYCFVINNNNEKPLTLVNSSKFVWKHNLDEKGFVDKIRKKKNLYNQKIIIDNKLKAHNIVIYSKVEEYEYVFFIVTSFTVPFYYLIIGIFRTLQPAFVKISNILLGEKKIQELKSEGIYKLSQRSQYVNQANKTMHFIRNRLGPFANLISQLDSFEKIPDEKIEKLKSLIFREKERAKIELKNITDRANSMLEKSTNPFVYSNTEQISIEKIYTLFKNNVSIFFPDIFIDVNVVKPKKKSFVEINVEGFEVFLSDWLNNISKYKNELAKFEFILKDDLLTINFINDHKLTDEEINKIITDLTSSDRNEIMKRTTHGLFIIKTILEEMNIQFNMVHNKDKRLLNLQLFLKTKEYEDSDI